MNITLKNIKHAAFASQETHCFEATVYVDGKRAFGVKNEGFGGCDDHFPLGKSHDYKGVDAQVREINKELGKTMLDVGKFEIPQDLDVIVCTLVNEWLGIKEAKKALRNIAIHEPQQKKGTYSSVKMKPTPENIASIKKASWFKKGFIVLNELSIEKAAVYL